MLRLFAWGRLSSVIISVPNDEYLARVELIAWLAYPQNERLRLRAVSAMHDLARHMLQQRMELRKDRLDSTLLRIDHFLDRNLLAGELFRRQLLERLEIQLDGQGLRPLFDVSSVKAMSRRMADARYRSDEREARRLFAHATPILHLAVGACDSLAERPGILTRQARGIAGQNSARVPGLLLDETRQWALRAVRIGQELKSEALKLGHPRAGQLADLSVFPLPPS